SCRAGRRLPRSRGPMMSLNSASGSSLTASPLGLGRQWPSSHMENPEIADRLDAFATLLELVDANPYQARAYRHAADTIRVAALPVAELGSAGRAKQLRGIGAGIEGRLRELVETGEIAELAELEREISPDLVGLGRYLGLSAKRSITLARSLDVHTADELRQAAADGRLRSVPGIGPKVEGQLLGALAAELERRTRHGLLLNR